MNKVYILHKDGWYDCSDNGRDTSEILGIYSSEELAFQAFEKEKKRLFGGPRSLENDYWGDHTELYITEHAVLDNPEIDEKDIYI